jgi:hypothetical protein
MPVDITDVGITFFEMPINNLFFFFPWYGAVSQEFSWTPQRPLLGVKPLRVGFTGIGPAFDSASWGPYSCKACPLRLHPTQNNNPTSVKCSVTPLGLWCSQNSRAPREAEGLLFWECPRAQALPMMTHCNIAWQGRNHCHGINVRVRIHLEPQMGSYGSCPPLMRLWTARYPNLNHYRIPLKCHFNRNQHKTWMVANNVAKHIHTLLEETGSNPYLEDHHINF